MAFDGKEIQSQGKSWHSPAGVVGPGNRPLPGDFSNTAEVRESGSPEAVAEAVPQIVVFHIKHPFSFSHLEAHWRSSILSCNCILPRYFKKVKKIKILRGTEPCGGVRYEQAISGSSPAFDQPKLGREVGSAI